MIGVNRRGIQTIVSASLKTILAVTLLGLLAACDGAATSAPGNVSQPVPSTTEPSVTFSPSPSATSTFPPTASPSPTTTGTPTSTLGPRWNRSFPLREPLEILTLDFDSEAFQDLIIFNGGGAWGPFANFRLSESGRGAIYAFSPNGERAGALTPVEFNSPIYLPSTPTEKPLLVGYGVNFDHPAVRSIELPPECFPQDGTTERFIPCSDFQFSPDGRYLGFFYGLIVCSRAIIILDTQTGEFVYQFPEPWGHGFILLDNGKALVGTGHCEGGRIALLNFNNHTETDLGESGSTDWNADRTAFVVETHPYSGISSSIWGFNLEDNQFFLHVPEIYQIDDHPIWTPDNRYLIYQHRTFSRDDTGNYPREFDQARQVILVDAQTGEQQILLSDPAYDFHLGSEWNRGEWYGDWIQVRRIGFIPEEISGGDGVYRTQQYTCRIYGLNCSSPVELFALNWKTGELVPWDDVVQAGLVSIPDPTEEPVPDRTQDPVYQFPKGSLYPGPDANTMWLSIFDSDSLILSGPDLESSPIYTHPNGLYAYYVGIDGKTLWMVPAMGDPVLWVIEGWNYVYVPPLEQ